MAVGSFALTHPRGAMACGSLSVRGERDASPLERQRLGKLGSVADPLMCTRGTPLAVRLSLRPGTVASSMSNWKHYRPKSCTI